MPSVPREHYDNLLVQNKALRRKLVESEAENDQWQRKMADTWAEVKRLRLIEQAARNLDAHRDEGYATLVSYLIRLHETLDAHDGQPALSQA